MSEQLAEAKRPALGEWRQYLSPQERLEAIRVMQKEGHDDWLSWDAIVTKLGVPYATVKLRWKPTMRRKKEGSRNFFWFNDVLRKIREDACDNDHFYIGKGKSKKLWITMNRAAATFDRSSARISVIVKERGLHKKKRWGKYFIRHDALQGILELDQKYAGALSILDVTKEFGFSKGMLRRYATRPHPITQKKLEPGLVQVPGCGPSYLFYPAHLHALKKLRDEAVARRVAVKNQDIDFLKKLSELNKLEAFTAFGINVFDIWNGRVCPYFGMKVFKGRSGWVARAPNGNVIQARLYKTQDLQTFADGYAKAIENSKNGLWIEEGVDPSVSRWRTYRIAHEEYGVEATWLLGMRNERCPEDGILVPAKLVDLPTHHSPRHGRKPKSGSRSKAALTWVFREKELIEKQISRNGWAAPVPAGHDHALHGKVDALQRSVSGVSNTAMATLAKAVEHHADFRDTREKVVGAIEQAGNLKKLSLTSRALPEVPQEQVAAVLAKLGVCATDRRTHSFFARFGISNDSLRGAYSAGRLPSTRRSPSGNEYAVAEVVSRPEWISKFVSKVIQPL